MSNYSNSPLVTYTRISPHRTSPRNHEIDTISIHCYVGQVTAKQGCDYFATTTRDCSSNYVVGRDGSIGLSCEEKDRSHCTSSRSNDHRAITIEVASDNSHPYAITDAAMEALIKLLVDICKRNEKLNGGLRWKADESLIGQVDKQNMTVHKWFAPKDCPGDYLYNLHDEIAEEVNKRLKGSSSSSPSASVLYRVQIGAFSVLANAKTQEKKAKSAGFQTYLVQVGKLYKVQIGAFLKESNANALLTKAKTAGFKDAFITTEAGSPVKVTKVIQKGSKVKVRKGARSYEGVKVSSFVYSKTYRVDELKDDRAVLDVKGLCTAFNVKDLILQT